MEQLRGIAPADAGVRTATASDVADFLRSTEAIDPVVLDPLKKLLGKLPDSPTRVELLRVLASGPDGDPKALAEAVGATFALMEEQGLSAATIKECLSQRQSNLLRSVSIGARWEECRRGLDELKALVVTNNQHEHEYQRVLERHHWIFGSEYSELLNRRNWVRDDRLDFMLRRTADAFLEVVEIKTPIEQALFRYDSSHDSYFASAPLSEVIGQVMRYIEEIESNRDAIHRKDGEDPFKIRARIIIGRDGDEDQASALRRLNGHLHRIEVLTFHQLIRIGERIVGIFQNAAVTQESEGSDQVTITAEQIAVVANSVLRPGNE